MGTQDRSPEAVARAHIEAVERGDVEAMAADYAADAVLERAGSTYRGRDAIRDYFSTVPARLGDARVVFDRLDVDGDTAVFSWHIEGAPAPTSGTDVCRIADGAIVSQTVHLDTTDF